MNIEIKKEQWEDFFDKLSKRRGEWMTEIEVLDPAMGDQILTRGLPLNGITAENAGGKTTIDISVGESLSNHLTHNIIDPIRVSLLSAGPNTADIVAIEEKDGTKTLIRFMEPMGILVGFAEQVLWAGTA